MIKNLLPAERLIVAADFMPEGISYMEERIKEKLFDLANSLSGTNVYIKINSVLRILGYGIIHELQNRGLKVFADLKLNDISETLKIDGMLLKAYKPDILTVMCSTGVKSMQALKKALPDTEILGVTVLTSMKEYDCKNIYNDSVESTVIRLANLAKIAGIGGLVASPKEAEMLKKIVANTTMTINTPGTRSPWTKVKGDDQNQSRVMTPYEAIMNGADRIIVGRPITTAKNPLEAVKRNLEEIEKACEDKKK